MEEEENRKILENLGELIRHTKCDPIFLATLKSKGILAQVDLEEIDAIGNNQGATAQAKRLFEILPSRVNAYQVLLEALEETCQSGVVKILEDNKNEIPAKTKKIRKFQVAPGYLKEFLDNCEENVLVIYTTNCEVTCDRIKETKNFPVYNQTETIQLISLTREAVCNQTIVVNSGILSKQIIRLASSLAQKSILVADINLQQPTHLLKTVDEQILWNELTPLCQSEIAQKAAQLTGLSEDDCFDILETADHNILIQLLQGNVPDLFQDTIPDNISYYIPRLLVTRNQLNLQIFQFKEAADIFVIRGIERHKLTEMTPERSTESSRAVIEKHDRTPPRFVVLEQYYHFDKLCQIIRDRPVHLLDYYNGTLTWIKSCGKIEVIQKFVNVNQDVLPESEFVDKLIKQHIKTPICISDTPGMGKTTLLARVSRKLKQQECHGTVAFLIISDLIAEVRKRSEIVELGCKLVSALSHLICTNQLGIASLNHNRNLLRELLLDAFDELRPADIQLGYNCLKALQQEFPNTRVWITSRPHMLRKLEETVQALGYNIQAFNRNDQEIFLNKYWSESIQVSLDTDRLTHFSQTCLDLVKSKITSTEEDFAGIPLQCLLIAQIYEDECQDYCTNNESNILFLPLFRIGSVTDMYEKLIELKFEKFAKRYADKNVDNQILTNTHVYYSLELLFPDNHPFTKKTFNQHLQIFDAGIMESKRTLYENIPRFVHRTFAEFFVATFLVDNLQTNCAIEVFEFMVNSVFKSKQDLLKTHCLSIKVKIMKHNVICYFVDALLRKKEINTSTELVLNVPLRQNVLLLRKVTETLEGAIISNFENIFNLIYNLSHDIHAKTLIITEKMVIVSTICNTKRFAVGVYEKFGMLDGVKLLDIQHGRYKLIDIAIQRGDYSIFEHLVQQEKSFGYFSDTNVITCIHNCLCYTNSLSRESLIDKAQILSYLLNREKFEYTYEKMKSAKWFQKNKKVHWTLSAKLIENSRQLSTDVVAIEEFMCKATEEHSVQDYTELLKYLQNLLEINFLKRVVHESNSKNKQPLVHHIVNSFGVNTELLEMLKSWGASVTTRDKENKSLIHTIINARKVQDNFEWLLENLPLSNAEYEDLISTSIKDLNQQALLGILNLKSLNITSKNCEHFAVLLIEKALTKPKILSKETFEILKLILKNSETISNKYLKQILSSEYNWNDEAGLVSFSLDMRLLLLRQKHCLNPIDENSKKEFYEILDWLIRNTSKFSDNTFEKLANKLLNAFEKRDHFTVINFSSKTEMGHLHSTVPFWNYPAAEWLLRNGSNVNMTSRWGGTPLHLLSEKLPEKFSMPMWKLFLDYSADPLLLDNYFGTPLDYLLSREEKCWFTCESLIYVLQKQLGKKPCKISDVILIASQYVDADIFNAVCDFYKKNHKLENREIVGNFNGKKCALVDLPSFSVYKTEVLNRILSMKTDEKVFLLFKSSVLVACAQSKHLTVWEKLNRITLVIDILQAEDNGVVLENHTLYPTHDSADMYSIITYSNTTKWGNGKTTLHYLIHQFCDNVNNQEQTKCIIEIQMTLIRRIITLGADVNAKDKSKNSPLVYAILRAKHLAHFDTVADLVKLLIDCGADVNGVNSNTNSPLLCSVTTRFPWQLFQLLVDKQADVTAVNFWKKNVLHLCAENTDEEIFYKMTSYMLNNGYLSVVTQKHKEFRTPLEVAEKQGILSEKTELLVEKFGIILG